MADLLVPFVAGQKTTAAALNDAFDITRVKHQDATQPSTSTTFVSSTYLVFSVVSASYLIEAQLFVDTNATADVKYNLLLPAGSTVRLAEMSGGTSSTSTQRSYAGVGAGTVISSNFSGYIDVSGTGTLTLQFGQVAASGTTTLQVGSWVKLTKVT